jgi:hypothetical protein
MSVENDGREEQHDLKIMFVQVAYRTGQAKQLT